MSNPFLRAYEFEKRYHLERLRQTLDKAEIAYRTHQPETIDLCKCAIESICKAIMDEKGQPYIDSDGKYFDLPRLIKLTLNHLGLQNDQARGGIASLVSGICDVRNRETFSGHGLEGERTILGRREINVFVSTFSHVIDMLIHLLEEDEIDITKTKMTFEALESRLNLAQMNEDIDTDVTVEYSKEYGNLFIDGKEIRPSEILYDYDRNAYAQRIRRAEEQQHDALRVIISDEICDRFDNFFPGHSGYEDPEIDFDEVKRMGNKIFASGSVCSSARLGSSREEDSIDVSYSSNFQAIIQDYADKGDPEALELASLELEITDWIQPEPEEETGT